MQGQQGLSDWPPGFLEGRGELAGLCARPPGWAEEEIPGPELDTAGLLEGATSKSIRMAIWAGVAWVPLCLGHQEGTCIQGDVLSAGGGQGGGPEGRRASERRCGAVAQGTLELFIPASALAWRCLSPTLSTTPTPNPAIEGHRSSDPRGTTTRTGSLLELGWLCFRTKLWTWTAWR